MLRYSRETGKPMSRRVQRELSGEDASGAGGGRPHQHHQRHHHHHPHRPHHRKQPEGDDDAPAAGSVVDPASGKFLIPRQEYNRRLAAARRNDVAARASGTPADAEQRCLLTFGVAAVETSVDGAVEEEAVVTAPAATGPTPQHGKARTHRHHDRKDTRAAAAASLHAAVMREQAKRREKAAEASSSNKASTAGALLVSKPLEVSVLKPHTEALQLAYEMAIAPVESELQPDALVIAAQEAHVAVQRRMERARQGKSGGTFTDPAAAPVESEFVRQRFVGKRRYLHEPEEREEGEEEEVRAPRGGASAGPPKDPTSTKGEEEAPPQSADDGTSRKRHREDDGSSNVFLHL